MKENYNNINLKKHSNLSVSKILSLIQKSRYIEWYKFRDKKYKEIAVKWCKKNNIEYEDGIIC